jgi:hypothetical protein
MAHRARRIAALTIVVLLSSASFSGVAAAKGADASCKTAMAAMSEAAAGMMSVGTGSDSASLDASLNALNAYAANAPKAVKPDFKKLTVAYAKAVKVLKQVKFDPKSGKMPSTADLAKLEQVTKALDTKELNAASKRIDAWFTKHCGATP